VYWVASIAEICSDALFPLFCSISWLNVFIVFLRLTSVCMAFTSAVRGFFAFRWHRFPYYSRRPAGFFSQYPVGTPGDFLRWRCLPWVLCACATFVTPAVFQKRRRCTGAPAREESNCIISFSLIQRDARVSCEAIEYLSRGEPRPGSYRL